MIHANPLLDANMNPTPASTFMDTLRRFFSEMTDFLGRLSLLRFLALCLLLMIFAGLAQNLFDENHQRHKPTIKINSDVRSLPPVAPPLPTVPNPGDAVPAPAAPGTATENKIEIKIGEKGIVISSNQDPKELDRQIEEQINKEVSVELGKLEREGKLDAGVSLPGVAVLLIVLMFIVRLIAQSKAKAETRARSAESAADSADLERQLSEAKMQAMQAQVEPHFLFNTLAAVEHLIETDPPRAAAMQRNLIAYLRSVLPNLRRTESTLAREIEISRNYLEILKVRMESRLDYSFSVPEGLGSATMPPLMLQTLMENAIEHGLEPKTDGGRIDVQAGIRDGLLIVTVADTGVGFAPGRVVEPKGERGVGLTSVRERLQALFGARGRLIIEPNQPSGTRAVLEFPYAFKPAHEPVAEPTSGSTKGATRGSAV